MTSFRPLPLLIGIGALVVPTVAQADIKQVCTLGATVRRIEVRFADGRDAMPCAVVYAKETERPGRESVLWTAESDPAFCTGQASGLAARLEQHGWQCRTEATAATVTALPVDPPEVPPPPPPRPDPPDPAETTAGAAAEPASREPAGPPTAGAESPSEGATTTADLRPDAPVPATTNGTAARDTQEPDGTIATALERVVERDLARLKTSSDDVVEASIETFGDLNGDDLVDAAVLITFDAEGSDYAQYLVAYVAYDESFRPAASRFIGGRYRKIFGAEVESIDDGRILLQLQVLEADDPYCCPSGKEAVRFALRNGELVDAR